MSIEPLPILPAAILFDMDGTLTEPMLDFPRIKSEMGIGTRPILEALKKMNARRRQAAEAVLLRHEEQAAAGSSLNAGCHELLKWLRDQGIGVALITRNSLNSVRTVLSRHELRIDVLITREDAPAKPDPQPLRLACRQLGVKEDRVWMVGDGEYDVEAGAAAAIATIWISHGKARSFSARPWLTMINLCELHDFLKKCARPGQPASW